MDYDNLDTGENSAPAVIRTSENAAHFESCPVRKIPDPCTVIILGASGDLTARKVIPAIYNLYLNNCLPVPFRIVGCARSRMDDNEFRNSMRKTLISEKALDDSKWQAFASCIHYLPVEYKDSSSFDALGKFLDELDTKNDTQGNRIFYLAIPPSLFEIVTVMIGKSGLSVEGQGGNPWSRVVVEKPFGHDLNSAVELDKTLHAYFNEHQIFRMDHYLAKETVQNILMFRFANSIFEPVWNRQYIDHISIIVAETLGVEHRAGYYEQAGVLRDMFQNHIMQLMALTAMEPPSLFDADRVRDEKVKIYRALRPFPADDIWNYLVLGQYMEGVIDGEEVPAYRNEPGVSPDSLVPTFATMKVFLDTWRWQGVPFYLTSGKRLANKLTEIAIQFRDVPHSMFRTILDESIRANRLALGIYPEEKISMTFQTKKPGATLCLRNVNMDFFYNQGFIDPIPEAYEKALLDCMLGDQMLFWCQKGVELCWEFLSPILRECEACGERGRRLLPYQAGTWGPDSKGDLAAGLPYEAR